MQSTGGSCAFERADRTFFQNTGSDTSEHILWAATLYDHVIDAGLMQELTKQQSGWSGADNGYLCSHFGPCPKD
jgi:hypothetical protein